MQENFIARLVGWFTDLKAPQKTYVLVPQQPGISVSTNSREAPHAPEHVNDSLRNRRDCLQFARSEPSTKAVRSIVVRTNQNG